MPEQPDVTKVEIVGGISPMFSGFEPNLQEY